MRSYTQRNFDITVLFVCLSLSGCLSHAGIVSLRTAKRHRNFVLVWWPHHCSFVETKRRSEIMANHVESCRNSRSCWDFLAFAPRLTDFNKHHWKWRLTKFTAQLAS